jgi:nicotinamidase-related amidase
MNEALVLIDFVNDLIDEKGAVAQFGTPLHAAKQNAVANTKAVLAHARAQGIKIIFVRVSFSEGHPELADTKAPFYVAHKDNNWLVRGTWGTKFHKDLQPASGEIVIEKNRVNPFTSPEFEKALEGIDKLALTGVATNLAIEETVRNAAAKDFEVIVLEDCCASNNQEMHDFSMSTIMPKFATVIKSSDYIAS